MARKHYTAKEGYLYTEIAEVAITDRTWARVKDTTSIKGYHQVPISEYEEWQKAMAIEIKKLMFNQNE